MGHGNLLVTLSCSHTINLFVEFHFPPDGDVIAAASRDGTARFWNGATDESIGQIHRAHQGSRDVLTVEYSSDGKLVYVVDDYGALKMWKFNGGPSPPPPDNGQHADIG